MNRGWEEFLKQVPHPWVLDPPILKNGRRDADPRMRLTAYQMGGGSRQRIRSHNPLERGYYDLPFYREYIAKLLALSGPDPLVVDLGCGDGRSVEILLEKEVSRIVALDFNVGDLGLLWEELGRAAGNRVLPVCSSITDPPPIPGVANAALMIEVAYILPDPLEAYRSCNRWLVPGGYALVSNPGIGEYLMHALLNRDWVQVNRVVDDRSYVDTVAGQHVKVNLFDIDTMVQSARKTGFEVVETFTIPGSPSVLRHGLKDQGNLDQAAVTLLEAAGRNVNEFPGIHATVLRKISD